MEEVYLEDLLRVEEADLNESAPEQEAEAIENKIEEENISQTLKLDYKLKTCEERAELVNRIVAQTPSVQLTNRYLEILGDYIIGGITKEEKKEKLYLTDNRMITINRHETSFEGLAEKFENGEDGIYNLITNDKNTFLSPRDTITEQDIVEIPGLKQLREDMAQIESAGKAAIGRKKYLLKKQLIEMRKDQYILKNAFRKPISVAQSTKGMNKIDLSEQRYIDKNGNPQSRGLISLFNPEHISALMRNYNALKIETQERYQDDFYYLLEDFDKLLIKALGPYPMYLDITKMKMNKKSNSEIQQMLKDKYNTQHTVQYISSLWRNKIPKIIAEQEQKDFLIWYYTYEAPEKAVFKKCSCCGQNKLTHHYFFSKNNTSKDNLYSICKECRNKK